jgi:acyl-CoA synthetase (AMP-forming)/AMP-acid ligase II
MDPNSTDAELVRDCELLNVKAVIVDSDTSPSVEAARKLGLPCVQVIFGNSTPCLFDVRLLLPGASGQRDADCNGPVLILATSGTSGQKKLVPYDMLTLVTSAACIIHAWKLEPEDACLNMMPLMHIGGIARNLLGTILSGGRLLSYSAFDPVAFWTGLRDYSATWYYATPAMHRGILQEGKQHPINFPRRLRMVCNAGGGLPPALFAELRDRFGCSVLAAYGMSECMPISSPPVTFTDSTPTNGPPCGPEVRIIDEQGAILEAGQVGSIVVRGPPVMAGYLSKEHNESAWINGWMAQRHRPGEGCDQAGRRNYLTHGHRGGSARYGGGS